METKAKIISFKPDYITGKANIHICLENVYMDELTAIERLLYKDVNCRLTEWKDIRSLNANKYFHVLSDKLADSKRISKSECKNYLLYEYGQKWRDEDGNLICIKTNAPVESLMQSKDFHVWYTKPAPDGTPMYVLLRHSSTFDTKEMSILIDGVVSECKDAGIEVLSPQKIKELKERWGVQ